VVRIGMFRPASRHRRPMAMETIVSRLRRMPRKLLRSARAGAELLDAVRVRPEAARLLHGPAAWEIGRFRRARSGTRIARLHSAREGAAVLKIAEAADGRSGLVRERVVLEALAHDPRVRDLRPFIPAVLDGGQDGRWVYLVQRALPGEPATRRLGRERQAILTGASVIAGRLHRATATPRIVTHVELEDWIEHPVAVIRQLVATRPSSKESRSLDRLAADLQASLRGHTVPLGWIHGDLWSDNILVARGSGTITGLVDWDSASDGAIAAHDQLHLVLYARKVLGGTPIGTQIQHVLGSAPQWDTTESLALREALGALPGSDDASRARLGVLLYWLRLVVTNLARQRKITGGRRWLDDNVRLVLECL
jgi:aminoglycoside phosphotransferase